NSMKLLLLIIAFVHFQLSYAQVSDFPIVSYSYFQNNQNSPEIDAKAFAILETGKTNLDISDRDQGLRVFHTYKVRLKILSQEGFDKANFTIPLYKFGNDFEYTEGITAKTYNLEDNRITETVLESK